MATAPFAAMELSCIASAQVRGGRVGSGSRVRIAEGAPFFKVVAAAQPAAEKLDEGSQASM